MAAPRKKPAPAVPANVAGLVKPLTLSDDASAMWDRMVQELEGTDLLRPLDEPSLEVACEAYARWAEAAAFRRERGILAKSSSGGVTTAPWVGIEERAAAQFRQFSNDFGLTPLARGDLTPPDGTAPKLRLGWELAP